MIAIEKKQAAYDYLASLDVMPDDFLEKSERDFETGDIFLRGVPAEPMDATRALDGLSSRVDAAIDARTMALKHPTSRTEIASLEEMNSMLMVLLIPSSLGWHVADEYKGTFATLLGAVWHKRNGWLARRIKQREHLTTVTPANIAAYLLDAPLDEFELKKLPYAAALDKWLTNKVAWQIEKEIREPSLDEPISDSEGNETTLVEIIPDPDADNEIIRSADRKLMLDELVGILKGAEKMAVTKFLRDEELTPTERRAKDRGVRRIQKYCEERGITYSI